jgi:hypothetical protein
MLAGIDALTGTTVDVDSTRNVEAINTKIKTVVVILDVLVFFFSPFLFVLSFTPEKRGREIEDLFSFS